MTDLLTAYVPPLTALRSACVERLGHAHAKTKALAVGFYNAWEAIFRVLLHPELPLTNKEAERTLRYWVIARQISHRTRTPAGSRVFALLAIPADNGGTRHGVTSRL